MDWLLAVLVLVLFDLLLALGGQAGPKGKRRGRRGYDE